MDQDLNELKMKLESTTDFLEQMEIQSDIHDMELKMGLRLPPKPPESPYLCEGCSS